MASAAVAFRWRWPNSTVESRHHPSSHYARSSPTVPSSSSSSSSSFLNADSRRFPTFLLPTQTPWCQLLVSKGGASGCPGLRRWKIAHPPKRRTRRKKKKKRAKKARQWTRDRARACRRRAGTRRRGKPAGRSISNFGFIYLFGCKRNFGVCRAASLDKEVFDALMLVKRLGHDVREGRRRQFNYIGKLLREAEPELMDGLILATKDGDNSKLQALARLETSAVEDVYEEEENTEFQDGCNAYVDTANRWLDGLINKDSSIINEVFSIYNVDFDRQELRKLVRQVQSIRERQPDEEKDRENSTLIKAKKTHARFLRVLAKHSVVE
ncbi:hypothetical protein Taro_048882 [Colocasia esculenta]|uniref:Uncharacterized protein n=1 Tax=Colocasia esculenta TaxID=4460 RepID=A0A843X9E3_COLES|nr:hypothetical protein [Colocasia esculenta]